MSVAARRKLKGVHLRADVRQILEEVKG